MSYTDEVDKGREEVKVSNSVDERPEGEIALQLAELTGQIEMIECAIANLGKIIAPVCNDLVLTDDGKKEKVDNRKSPVGQVLFELTKRANGIVAEVDTLGERVEL